MELITLNIPQQKSADFSKELFSVFFKAIEEFGIEFGVMPNKIIFGGPLGKEVLFFIQEANWNILQWNPEAQDGPNRIFLKYTKEITQIEERGSIPMGDSLNGRVISGIPDPVTMGKIVQHAAGPGFTIERKLRPESWIKLVRKS
jgi:hypothetical protein